MLRLLKPLDERMSIKLLLRVWGPRVEFLVRLILVATFFDDSLRTATHFSEHVKQVSEQGLAALMSPDLADAVAGAALGFGVLAQSLGSICLLALVQTDFATKALLGWAVAQPVLYAQLSNGEFVAESLSLVGGLLMLRAHLAASDQPDGELGKSTTRAAAARTQLLGRLLLPTGHLHHAGTLLLSMSTYEVTDSLLTFVGSLSMFVVHAAVLMALVLGCALVAAGLKSRTAALSLALVNLGVVCSQHPFFRFAWYDVGGEWTYDEAEMRKSSLSAALQAGVLKHDIEPWQMYDLHRYYFFQGLSASGALLLLAQFGPGEISVEEETLLPVFEKEIA